MRKRVPFDSFGAPGHFLLVSIGAICYTPAQMMHALTLPSWTRARVVCAMVLLLIFAKEPRVFGELVFDNTATNAFKEFAYFSIKEHGDEITLGGTARTLTDFLFEYYSDFVATGDEMARLRIYRNDGERIQLTPTFFVNAPGTLLYESPPFQILGKTNPSDPLSGYHDTILTGLAVDVPRTFTWSIEFQGLSGAVGDRAALVVRDPPTVGRSFTDYWDKVTGNWGLRLLNVPANFAVRINAVPEPATIAYALLGGLFLAGAWWRSRTNSRQ
jgi:hypothetical protein